MNTIKTINIILLTIVSLGMGMKVKAINCSSCIGFDAEKKTGNASTLLANFLQGQLPDVGPFEDQCYTNPSNVITCDSVCSFGLATFDPSKYAGSLNMTEEETAWKDLLDMGRITVITRGCVHNIFRGDLYPDILSNFEEILCNHKKCNSTPQEPQPTDRSHNAGERMNAIQSTTTLIVPVLLSLLLKN